ncbi:MAG: DUF4870 domain-containing protein, partial [Cyanobacteria bacterium J06638_22]
STLCHLSTFLNWLIIPLIIPIIVICISEDEITIENAKEAINFHISFVLYYVFIILSFFLIIGFLLLPVLILLIIADYILPIIAIVNCTTRLNKPYRYPFIFRLV